MDMVQHKIKEILTKELETCRNTWMITARELQEVLISMAGDLAIEESHLTQRAADGSDAPQIVVGFVDRIIQEKMSGAKRRR